MTETPAIEAFNLTAAYERLPVLWQVGFRLPQGVIAGIIGPNGSGKSSLLKSAMGLLEPSAGWIKLFDKPINEVRHQVGYVPQRESVDWDFPATVMDVVLMGRYRKAGFLARLRKQDFEKAEEALQMVGMVDFRNRQIGRLSGGQQQRVFIARMLAQNPDLMLLDEPFSGVDAASEDLILTLFTQLKNNGKTLVVVHHDIPTAGRFFDWIVLLNTGLVACGPTSDCLTAENLDKAYGGRLTLIDEARSLADDAGIPITSKRTRHV